MVSAPVHWICGSSSPLHRWWVGLLILSVILGVPDLASANGRVRSGLISMLAVLCVGGVFSWLIRRAVVNVAAKKNRRALRDKSLFGYVMMDFGAMFVAFLFSNCILPAFLPDRFMEQYHQGHIVLVSLILVLLAVATGRPR